MKRCIGMLRTVEYFGLLAVIFVLKDMLVHMFPQTNTILADVAVILVSGVSMLLLLVAIVGVMKETIGSLQEKNILFNPEALAGIGCGLISTNVWLTLVMGALFLLFDLVIRLFHDNRHITDWHRIARKHKR